MKQNSVIQSAWSAELLICSRSEKDLYLYESFYLYDSICQFYDLAERATLHSPQQLKKFGGLKSLKLGDLSIKLADTAINMGIVFESILSFIEYVTLVFIIYHVWAFMTYPELCYVPMAGFYYISDKCIGLKALSLL